MAKVYIVSSTNFEIGYEQKDILTPFSTKEKAKEFFEKEKGKVIEEVKENNRNYEIEADKETYFLVTGDGIGHWYEVILIEKDLK